MSFARGNAVVIGMILLQHSPHRGDVIAGMAPVAPGIQIAKSQLAAQAKFDPGSMGSNLSGHKLKSAPRAVVIEQYPSRRMQAIGFPIISSQVESGHLGHAINRTRVKSSVLI